MGFSDVDADNKPVSFQQTFKLLPNHLQELQQKEDEMRQMFVVRVKEKESELKEAEKEVCSCTVFFVFILPIQTQIIIIFISHVQSVIFSLNVGSVCKLEKYF